MEGCKHWLQELDGRDSTKSAGPRALSELAVIAAPPRTPLVATNSSLAVAALPDRREAPKA